MNFKDPGYLFQGSPLQIQVAKALENLGVFERLSDYHPVLAGTYPLDLALPGSDLDILCEVHQPEVFTARMRSWYGSEMNFSVRNKQFRNIDSVIIRFTACGFPLEFFAQPVPVVRQDAYLHLVTEAYLLRHDLSGSREALLELKRSGMTTEEAFARLMGLSGDPYKALIDLGEALHLFS